MAKFDVVKAAASGYQYVWMERKKILPLAVLPFFVKTGSFAAVALLGLEANILRQGLIFLPSFFMEAFIVVVVIRMSMFGERYDKIALGADKIDNGVKRAVLAGVLVYVLTKMVSYFLLGTAMMAKEIEKNPALPQPQGSPYMMSLLILVFAVWAVRFFWLYVPVAMGMTAGRFLNLIRPITSSLYLIALWLFCSVPLSVVLLGVAQFLMTVFPGGDGQGSLVYTTLIAPVHAVIELSIAAICGVAMAHALRNMINAPQKPKGLF
jgi:hypothetical protein